MGRSAFEDNGIPGKGDPAMGRPCSCSGGAASVLPPSLLEGGLPLLLCPPAKRPDGAYLFCCAGFFFIRYLLLARQAGSIFDDKVQREALFSPFEFPSRGFDRTEASSSAV
jgi:hypothetical protein